MILHLRQNSSDTNFEDPALDRKTDPMTDHEPRIAGIWTMKEKKHNWFKWFKSKLHRQTQTPEQNYQQTEQGHQIEKIERQNMKRKSDKHRYK